MELVSPLMGSDQDPARIIVNRLIFFVFFVYFIRTPQQVRLVFLLAVSLMVLSGFAAIWYVLSGYGFAGYRARSGLFIAAAGNPNRLALAAIIGIIALWYLMQWQRRTILTVVVMAVIAIEVLAIFMTGSRSGVTALCLAAFLLFVEGGLSPQRIIVGALATLVAVLLVVRAAPEESLERIANLPGTEGASDAGAGSVERRGYVASLAIEIARQNPLIGVGIGNWEISRYLADPVHNITPPHSAVLMALAEGGFITLGLYIALLVRTLRHFLDSAAALQQVGGPGYLIWMTKTLRASFIIFLVLSLVGDLWLNILFYWFVGLGVTLSRLVFEPAEAVEPGREPALLGAAA
jgi:O-antigen ligase